MRSLSSEVRRGRPSACAKNGADSEELRLRGVTDKRTRLLPGRSRFESERWHMSTGSIARIAIADLSDEWRAEFIAMQLEGRKFEYVIGDTVTTREGLQFQILHANATCDHILVTYPV